MANLETAVFATIEALADLPDSIKPIIAARKSDVDYANMMDEPVIGFEGWLSFIANALVITESTDAPFSFDNAGQGLCARYRGRRTDAQTSVGRTNKGVL